MRYSLTNESKSPSENTIVNWNEDNLPTSVLVDTKLLELKASPARDLDIKSQWELVQDPEIKSQNMASQREFYRVSDETGNRVLSVVRANLFNRSAKQIKAGLADDYLYAGTPAPEPPGDEDQTVPLQSDQERQALAGAWEEACAVSVEWLDHLKESGIPITVRAVNVPEDGVSITHYRIGKFEEVEKEAWTNTVEAAVSVHKLNTRFPSHFGRHPQNITVFEFSDLERTHLNLEETESIWKQITGTENPMVMATAKHSRYTSPATFEAPVAGQTASEAPIIIYDYGRLIDRGNGPKVEVDTNETKKAVRHELAHKFDDVSQTADPFDPRVTIKYHPSASEGFATMAENDFSFLKCREELRVQAKYDRQITKELLEHVFKGNEPVSTIELYLVSATFLSYAYEKLGPHGFSEYFREICKNEGAQDNLDMSLGSATFSGRTTISFSLRESLIPDYLKDVNLNTKTKA